MSLGPVQPSELQAKPDQPSIVSPDPAQLRVKDKHKTAYAYEDDESEYKEESEAHDDSEGEDDEGIMKELIGEHINRTEQPSGQCGTEGSRITDNVDMNAVMFEESDEEEGVPGGTISSTVPEGMHLQKSTPRISKRSIEGKQFVFRYDTGWFHGQVGTFFSAAQKRKLPRADAGCNCDVRYTGEDFYRNICLDAATYYSEDNPDGRWAICVPN